MKTNPRVTSFASEVLLRHLNALQQEVAGVRAAQDIEPIHRMRVASRRLRAALPLFSDCYGPKRTRTWLQHIRHLTQALGAARDADVQIDLLAQIDENQAEARLHAGLRRLLLRLRQQRLGLQAGVEAALDEIERSGFAQEMQTLFQASLIVPEAGAPLPHELYQRSAQAISACLDAFLAYEPFITRPECVAELHAMRIAAKKLRYTLETFASLYPDGLEAYLAAVKACQELLGNIHDCDVWLALLPEFSAAETARTLAYFGHTRVFNPLKPGLAFFEANRRDERVSQYDEFLRRWEKVSARQTWPELRQVLALPLQGAIYPPAPPAISGPDPIA